MNNFLDKPVDEIIKDLDTIGKTMNNHLEDALQFINIRDTFIRISEISDITFLTHMRLSDSVNMFQVEIYMNNGRTFKEPIDEKLFGQLKMYFKTLSNY